MKFAIGVFGIVAFAQAPAQWTVVNLHPAGAFLSHVFDIAGGQQVGFAQSVGGDFATLWTGTAASAVNLHPTSGGTSYARGVAGGSQGGSLFNFQAKACLWAGTPESFVDLHPAGYATSEVYSVDPTQQAGYVSTGSTNTFAAKWTGTAASFVNLHPAGATRSLVYALGDGVQVGQAHFGGTRRAGMWSGSAASWVSLHPIGSFESTAFAADGAMQGGFAHDGTGLKACIWQGTEASLKYIHPAGQAHSYVLDMDGPHQVGSYYTPTNSSKACYWTGTASSMTDLVDFMPPEYVAGQANGIFIDGDIIYIVGSAEDSVEMRYEATMWVSRVVTPTYTPLRGIVTGGNQQSIAINDDNYLTLRPGIVFSTSQAPVEIRFDAVAPMSNPNGLTFSLETGANFGNAQQEILLFNYVTGAYEVLDSRLLTVADDVAYVTVRTNPQRFIQSGTLAIRAAVRIRAVGPSFVYPWTVRVDRSWWNFPG
jgi:hypothetical protein